MENLVLDRHSFTQAKDAEYPYLLVDRDTPNLDIYIRAIVGSDVSIPLCIMNDDRCIKLMSIDESNVLELLYMIEHMNITLVKSPNNSIRIQSLIQYAKERFN